MCFKKWTLSLVLGLVGSSAFAQAPYVEDPQNILGRVDAFVAKPAQEAFPLDEVVQFTGIGTNWISGWTLQSLSCLTIRKEGDDVFLVRGVMGHSGSWTEPTEITEFGTCRPNSLYGWEGDKILNEFKLNPVRYSIDRDLDRYRLNGIRVNNVTHGARMVLIDGKLMNVPVLVVVYQMIAENQVATRTLSVGKDLSYYSSLISNTSDIPSEWSEEVLSISRLLRLR